MAGKGSHMSLPRSSLPANASPMGIIRKQSISGNFSVTDLLGDWEHPDFWPGLPTVLSVWATSKYLRLSQSQSPSLYNGSLQLWHKGLEFWLWHVHTKGVCSGHTDFLNLSSPICQMGIMHVRHLSPQVMVRTAYSRNRAPDNGQHRGRKTHARLAHYLWFCKCYPPGKAQTSPIIGSWRSPEC